MKKIAILTSGGDAPGMNAALRAVVRKAIYRGLSVIGVEHGYHGLMHREFKKLDTSSVGDIILRGGTILRTARSEEFKTTTGRATAYSNLSVEGVEGLICIGGDGTFTGAKIFSEEYKVPVVGIPGTIDNDIGRTDYTIGFDTAVNTVIDAINKIRDTATSHERTFVLEVMGRNSGQIALTAGLAGGAESILIPEVKWNLDAVINKLKQGYDRGKLHSIILVAEGAGEALDIGKQIKAKTGFDTRVAILGHIQRGGAPSAWDSALATRMGAFAVDLLLEGQSAVMTAIQGTKLLAVPFDEALSNQNLIDMDVYNLAGILAT